MSCIFCQIAAGKIPCYKVYEDNDFLAFLDIRPLTRGNTLIIPKKHYRWVADVSNFGAYFEVAKKVGLATVKTLGAKWLQFLTIGLEVPHAHIRVIPRYSKDRQPEVPSLEIVESFSDEEMKAISDKIRAELE